MLEMDLQKKWERATREGELKSRREAVLRILSKRFGGVSEDLQKNIRAIQDMTRLSSPSRTPSLKPF